MPGPSPNTFSRRGRRWRGNAEHSICRLLEPACRCGPASGQSRPPPSGPEGRGDVSPLGGRPPLSQLTIKNVRKRAIGRRPQKPAGNQEPPARHLLPLRQQRASFGEPAGQSDVTDQPLPNFGSLLNRHLEALELANAACRGALLSEAERRAIVSSRRP